MSAALLVGIVSSLVVGWIVAVVWASFVARNHLGRDRYLEQGRADSGHVTNPSSGLTLPQCRIVAEPFTGWTTKGDFQYYFAKGKLIAALRGDLYYPYTEGMGYGAPTTPPWVKKVKIKVSRRSAHVTGLPAILSPQVVSNRRVETIPTPAKPVVPPSWHMASPFFWNPLRHPAAHRARQLHTPYRPWR